MNSRSFSSGRLEVPHFLNYPFHGSVPPITNPHVMPHFPAGCYCPSNHCPSIQIPSKFPFFNSVLVTLEISCHVPGTFEYIKSQVPEKYHGFINVFIDKEVTQLPPHQDQDIAIELEEGKTPPFGPIYSLMPMEKEALHSYISDNLAKGFIHSSTSLAASPILFVKKPNGSLHLCVDYCGLNAMTRQNRYPLPLVNELLDAI